MIAVPGVPVAVHFVGKAQINQLAPVFCILREIGNIGIAAAAADRFEGVIGVQPRLPGNQRYCAITIDCIAICAWERGVPVDVPHINRQVSPQQGFKSGGVI